jgi:hypothetical protein
MKYILNRLTEASSWSAIAAFAAIFVHNVPTPQVQAIATVVGVVGGLVGVLKPEAGAKVTAIANAAARGVSVK